ncbi:MAG: isoprenylcysteine carboxylmethyltransferase family protein [Acidobacteriota bacterium]|nr:isoprenylcysteine carboxylmethyltransferase family protein [Acidobacteriota bacterium]
MNHDRVLALFYGLWAAVEIVVFARRRAGSRQDRGSHIVLWVLVGGGIFAAGRLRRWWPMPDRDTLFWLGIALIFIGIVIRAAAILTLGRYFSVRVTIQEAHELIQRGLYRWIRHPAYTGLLLSFTGLGFALGSWLSLAIIAITSIIGFGYRIRVEEQALIGHFGDRYRSYAARTKRLVPGIY